MHKTLHLKTLHFFYPKIQTKFSAKEAAAFPDQGTPPLHTLVSLDPLLFSVKLNHHRTLLATKLL